MLCKKCIPGVKLKVSASSLEQILFITFVYSRDKAETLRALWHWLQLTNNQTVDLATSMEIALRYKKVLLKLL